MMKLIVCLDDRDGMTFLGRRQSQDAVLRQDMLSYVAGGKLWMNSYSAAQFSGDSRICVSRELPDQVAEEDYCFVEDLPVEDFLPARELVIYRWNRHYPSDIKFPLALALEGMHPAGTTEFAGSSHERIIREVYRR